MTIDAARLSTALQLLIDARLNTIDRMLLDVVSRQDRLAIVRDVESQILEQLQRRGTDELSREDVLAVLATLDPPEAYLPEDSADSPREPRAVPTIRRASEGRASAGSGKAKASGVLGILTLVAAILLPVLSWTIAMFLESEFVFFAGEIGSGILVSVGGVLSIIFAANAGLRHGWAIAGLITSTLAMGIVLCFLGFLVLQFVVL